MGEANRLDVTVEIIERMGLHHSQVMTCDYDPCQSRDW